MTDSLKIMLLATSIAAGAGLAIADDGHPRNGLIMDHDGAFGRFDLDGDGSVTADELSSVRATRFAEVDTDGDGQVTEEEFLAHARSRAEAHAREMFSRLDADGDGALTLDTLAALFEHAGGARIMERLDADGDGAVSRDEFGAMLSEHRRVRHGAEGGHRRQ